MNRIERISAILIQLQSKKVVTGQEIANRFSISLRTAYRDIKALGESGVPIVGEAGMGYSLMAGYKLPPVMFTKEEATSFLTAEKLVEKLTDSATYQTYQSALFKIKAVLKTEEKDHLETMAGNIAVLPNPYLPPDKKTSDHLQVILNSIAQKTVLNIDYFANHSQQCSSRNTEPVGIFLMAGRWHLIAFCWLRNDYRNFRIDRILKSKATTTPFQKQHPPLKTYLKELSSEKKQLFTIVMRTEKDLTKHLNEQKFYNGFVSEKEVNGTIEMTFLTPSIEGFARWYLMFGDRAEIISPKSLKTRIKEISSVILNKVR